MGVTGSSKYLFTKLRSRISKLVCQKDELFSCQAIETVVELTSALKMLFAALEDSCPSISQQLCTVRTDVASAINSVVMFWWPKSQQT